MGREIREQVILDQPTKCDFCERNIPAGEPVINIYECFDSDYIPTEEIRSVWLFSSCINCTSPEIEEPEK